MFNYTKETIVNAVSGKVFAGTGVNANGIAESAFIIKRAAEYDFAKIKDGKIFKTAPVAPVCAEATLTVDGVAANELYRIAIFVKTPTTEFAEFGMANWYEYGRPILVEVRAKEADDNKFAAQIVSALNLCLPYDNPFFKAEAEDNVVTIKLAESWMAFDTIEVSVYDAINDDFVAGGNITPAISVANVEEFATAKWLVENLRFPTALNLRYAHLYADETPVAGKSYTEYSFEYENKRSPLGGLSTIGQEVNSITRHIIYVDNDLVSAFETELKKCKKADGSAVIGWDEAAGPHDGEKVITVTV